MSEVRLEASWKDRVGAYLQRDDMRALQYRGGDEAHGAFPAIQRPYIDVHGEATSMTDGVGA